MEGEPPPAGVWGAIRTEVERFRWGGGVVSNTTAAIVAALIAVAATSWALSAHPILAASIDGGIFIVLIIYLFGTWRFADKHPDLAALGGSEYLRYRQLEMGTKEAPQIPAAPNVRPPPAIEGGAQ